MNKHNLFFNLLKFKQKGKKNEIREKLKTELRKNKIDIELILDNLRTFGWSGVFICLQILRNQTFSLHIVENMKRAKNRHLFTEYDSVNKKGLSLHKVKELREKYNLKLKNE